MNKKAVIFGTGSFAEVAHFYLSHDSDYNVVAFTASRNSITKNSLFDLPVVPFEDVENIYSPDGHDMFIAIGYRDRNKIRETFYRQAKNKNFKLLSYVSSRATTWPGLSIGDNCFIFEDNTIQPFVKIGNNVVLWSGNHIGHHSAIDDHCFITSQVVISGLCHIKEYSFLGVNATIRDGITIEKDNVIGAGALILKSTKEHEVYPGNRSRSLPNSSTIKLD